jgi:hypothetical protein
MKDRWRNKFSVKFSMEEFHDFRLGNFRHSLITHLLLEDKTFGESPHSRSHSPVTQEVASLSVSSSAPDIDMGVAARFET